MTDNTSINLLVRLQSGEEAAWPRLVRLYAPLIRFWFRKWGVAEGDLEDMTQEVWLVLGPTLGTYRQGTGRSFRAWLHGVAKHKSREWYRRRSLQLAEAEGGSDVVRRFGLIEATLDEVASTDPGEVAENKALYRRALELVQGEFEDRTWRAFLGVAIEGNSASEVGANLGLTAAAVRMAKCRVLNRLRQELGELLT